MKALSPNSLRRKIRSTYVAFKYRGEQVECPCCKTRQAKFYPFGVTLRDNALCMVCGSLERHRLLWLFFQQKTNLFDSSLKVLHFAPELAFAEHFSRMKNLHYVRADIDPGKAILRMDVTNIQFADNAFDVILCCHVLEHVIDDTKALSELYRVLKPGGWAILQTPFDPNRETTFEDPAITAPEEREKAFGQNDHVRIYGKDYVKRLKNAGFSVEPDPFVKQFDVEQLRFYGLPPDEEICKCTKEAVDYR